MDRVADHAYQFEKMLKEAQEYAREGYASSFSTVDESIEKEKERGEKEEKRRLVIKKTRWNLR